MIFKRKKRIANKGWDDITIAKHKRILDLYDRYKDEEDKTFLQYELVGIVYDIDEDTLNSMKISEANEYVNGLRFLAHKPRPKMAKPYYTLNGHRYKTTFNFQQLTTSQYIDFQQIAPNASTMPAEFLACILIPEGKTYNKDYVIDDVISDIENYMTLEDCLGLTAFFLTLLRLLMRRSVRMLRRMVSKAEREGMMTSEQLEALRRTITLIESGGGLKG